MPTLHLLGRLVLLVGFASVLLADEKPTRPQWQRLLTGEDLRLAQIMENHFTHHWQNANFKDASAPPRTSMACGPEFRGRTTGKRSMPAGVQKPATAPPQAVPIVTMDSVDEPPQTVEPPFAQGSIIGTWMRPSKTNSTVFTAEGLYKSRHLGDSRLAGVPAFQNKWWVYERGSYSWVDGRTILMKQSNGQAHELRIIALKDGKLSYRTQTLGILLPNPDVFTVERVSDDTAEEVGPQDVEQELQQRFERLGGPALLFEKGLQTTKVLDTDYISRSDFHRKGPYPQKEDPKAYFRGKAVAVSLDTKKIDTEVMKLFPQALWAFSPDELGTVIHVSRDSNLVQYEGGVQAFLEDWSVSVIDYKEKLLVAKIRFAMPAPEKISDRVQNKCVIPQAGK